MYVVLRHSLDVIAFLAVTCAATAWCWWTVRQRFRESIFSSAVLRVGLIVSLFSAVIGPWMGGRERVRIEQMLATVAPVFALEMDQAGAGKVLLETHADDPTYLRLVEMEKVWQQICPQLADIYTIRKAPDGAFALCVDAETDYDRNGQFDGEREGRTAIGELYTNDVLRPTIERAFAGRAGFCDEIYSDRWGDWVTALEPMRNGSGQVYAVLGVDFPAKVWVDSVLLVRGEVLLMGLTVAAIALVTAHLMAVQRHQVRLRVEAEKEKDKMHAQLVLASRSAGMADMAIGVLHNVGNVLNSVNVSARTLSEQMGGTRLPTLSRVAETLAGEAEAGTLGVFVTENERGRCLPALLRQLHGALAEEQEAAQGEMASLLKGVEHVTSVIQMQQEIAAGPQGVQGTGGVRMEETSAAGLLDDALDLAAKSGAAGTDDVEFVRDYRTDARVSTDRHLALQVLVNLVTNARKAVLQPASTGRRIVLRTLRTDDGWIALEVQDSGIGIAPESIGRVFGQGYTTWEGGHGFGLHSAANDARRMGGTLEVFSDGLGQGARFRLKLAEPIAVGRKVAA